MRLIRKSSCTSVHCGFRIFANLEIPLLGWPLFPMPRPAASCPATPALPHCMPCIVSSILPSYFIHHVLDVIARNRICPVFSILSYHTLLIRLIHSILFYPIPPIYPPARLAQVPLACFPGISVSGVSSGHPTWHSFLHSGNRKRAAS